MPAPSNHPRPRPTTVFRPVVSPSTPESLAALAVLIARLALAPGRRLPKPAAPGRSKPAATSATPPSTARGCGSGTSPTRRAAASPRSSPAPRRNGIGTVYVKSGDGGGAWSQFSRGLVQALHRGGLDVCAWQFVYGDNPLAEAKVAAAAVAKGADCFVIDAEADYEGKYAAADRYVRALRARDRRTFPVSLAGFPYVDYHPSFPYSVFFGPGGAQYNQPQMYWKTIGTSVRAVYEHTYLYNRIWGHPIYPIGQTYEGPGAASIRLFRRFAASYGGLPPSWWDWQETSGRSGGRSAPPAPCGR